MANKAAWLVAAKASPFEVRDAPMPQPGPGQVVMKVAATAINPVDWKIQQYGLFIQKFPFILGEDMAGEVTAVGPGVTQFKPGDRVLSHSVALASQDTQDASFQQYARAAVDLTAKVPAGLDLSQASVLPLAVSTAAHGLYAADHLALPLPSLSPKSTGKSLLVWGGSSSVGAIAIQLAVASGVEVIATASKHNFDFVKSMGASHVIDHTSATAVDEVVDLLKGKTVVGAYDAISTGGTIEKSAEVLSRSQGGKFVAATLEPPKELPAGTSSKGVFALNIRGTPVVKGVWEDFLPAALEQGKFKAQPPALVAGKGLEYIQKGCDMNQKGVSAKKVVITL